VALVRELRHIDLKNNEVVDHTRTPTATSRCLYAPECKYRTPPSP